MNFIILCFITLYYFLTTHGKRGNKGICVSGSSTIYSPVHDDLRSIGELNSVPNVSAYPS